MAAAFGTLNPGNITLRLGNVRKSDFTALVLGSSLEIKVIFLLKELFYQSNGQDGHALLHAFKLSQPL